MNARPAPALHNQSVSYLAPLRRESFERGWYIVGNRIEQRIAGPYKTEREAEQALASAIAGRHPRPGVTP
jgi:hypothetical protein